MIPRLSTIRRLDYRHSPRRRGPVIRFSLVLVSAGLVGGAVQIRGLDGAMLTPFAPAAAANVLFFVATDCPVSNTYAPTIQRLCREYAPRGVSCALMYEDVDTARSPAVLDDVVRAHLAEYRYGRIAA